MILHIDENILNLNQNLEHVCDVLETFISSKTGDKDMLQINGRIEIEYN